MFRYLCRLGIGNKRGMWFPVVENLSDFSVDFIKQFVSSWWWAIPKINVYVILRFYWNRENLMLVGNACFTVQTEIPSYTSVYWLQTRNMDRGATTSSKLVVQFLGLGYYYPATEKIRQIYPVWCSRLYDHTLFIQSYVKSWGSVQILGRSGPLRPSSGCNHEHGRTTATDIGRTNDGHTTTLTWHDLICYVVQGQVKLDHTSCQILPYSTSHQSYWQILIAVTMTEWVFSEAVLKVCTDSWLNNTRATVLQFKTRDFPKFCQRFNYYFHHKSGFLSLCQLFQADHSPDTVKFPGNSRHCCPCWVVLISCQY